MTSGEGSLKHSAGSGLIWGVAFNLGRDIIQFASMLILVRLLSPQIYGQFALAQTIQLFLAVASFKTIAPFALQARDPLQFDWDTHFSAGATLNGIMTAVTLAVAAGFFFYGGEDLKVVGFVLALMAFVFPIEVMSTHYFLWLQAFHMWRRMRLLLLFGALASALISVALAATGAGIVALAVGNAVFVLPLIADYCLRRPYAIRFRLDWYRRYQEGRAFAANRIAAASLQTGSAMAEQSVISGIFGFSSLGIYSRSIGLAQITSGRIGPVVTQALYPVLTRAEASTDRFRRFAGILFQGAVWTSFPAAAFLGLEADGMVRLLYGENWLDVIPLMGAASALLALRGIHVTMNQIMVANLQQRTCLRLEVVAGISQLFVLAVAFLGLQTYLWALACHAGFIVSLTLLFGARTGTIDFRPAVKILASCILATAAASAVMISIPVWSSVNSSTVSLVGELALRALCFGSVYGLGLRLLTPKSFISLVNALPLPRTLERAVGLVFRLPRNPT